MSRTLDAAKQWARIRRLARDSGLMQDAFEEGQHPRGEGGQFTVTTKIVPHYTGTHHNVNGKQVKAQNHEVHVNGEHVGNVGTFVKHVERFSMGHMRPTGKMKLGWSSSPKGHPSSSHHSSKQDAVKSVVAARHGYAAANNAWYK